MNKGVKIGTVIVLFVVFLITAIVVAPSKSNNIQETYEYVSNIPNAAMKTPIVKESEETETSETTEENDYEIASDFIPFPTEKAKEKKINIMKLSEKQMKKLTLNQKAKAVGLSVKAFKNMTSVINHEAGTQMEDKILVAAVIWNRVRCEKFPNSVNKVINQSGQFYDIKKDKSGSWEDKKAQLAILIAYKRLKKKQIPHNLLFFNSISYNTKNKRRYKPYKHYGNYFLKDSYCWCDWCKKTQIKGM